MAQTRCGLRKVTGGKSLGAVSNREKQAKERQLENYTKNVDLAML
jgi:hypothetical protein